MKLQPITSTAHPNKIVGYRFFCPGCKDLHQYWIVSVMAGGKTHPVWDFDGNLESPTFSPSLRRTGGPADDPDICHLTLTSGLFHFHADSTHELSGKQDIPMEEYPMSPDQEKNDPSLESGSVASLRERKAEAKAVKAAKAVAEADQARADEAKTEAKVVEAIAMAEKKRQSALEDEAKTEAAARELGKDLGAPKSGTGPDGPESGATYSGPPGQPGPPGILPEDDEEALTVDEVIEQALRTFEDLSERERLNVLYASLIRIARALYGPDEKVSNPLLGL